MGVEVDGEIDWCDDVLPIFFYLFGLWLCLYMDGWMTGFSG